MVNNRLVNERFKEDTGKTISYRDIAFYCQLLFPDVPMTSMKYKQPVTDKRFLVKAFTGISIRKKTSIDDNVTSLSELTATIVPDFLVMPSTDPSEIVFFTFSGDTYFGHRVVKEVVIKETREWQIRVAGKVFDVEDFLVPNECCISKTSVANIINFTKYLKVCPGFKLLPEFEEFYDFEGFSKENWGKAGESNTNLIYRSEYCTTLITPDLERCKLCQGSIPKKYKDTNQY